MKKQLAILWLENAAALVHVIAMTFHETAAVIRKSERQARRQQRPNAPSWLTEAREVREPERRK